MESGNAETQAEVASERSQDEGVDEEGEHPELALDEAGRRRALDDRQQHPRHRPRHRGVS